MKLTLADPQEAKAYAKWLVGHDASVLSSIPGIIRMRFSDFAPGRQVALHLLDKLVAKLGRGDPDFPIIKTFPMAGYSYEWTLNATCTLKVWGYYGMPAHISLIDLELV